MRYAVCGVPPVGKSPCSLDGLIDKETPFCGPVFTPVSALTQPTLAEAQSVAYAQEVRELKDRLREVTTELDQTHTDMKRRVSPVSSCSNDVTRQSVSALSRMSRVD